MLIDSRPNSFFGWEIVARGGSVYGANRISSKPTTETSSGMRPPLDLMPRIAPVAISSFEQKIAENFSLRAYNCPTARIPDSTE